MSGFLGVFHLWAAGWFRRCAHLHGSAGHFFAALAEWFETRGE